MSVPHEYIKYSGIAYINSMSVSHAYIKYSGIAYIYSMSVSHAGPCVAFENGGGRDYKITEVIK